MNEAEELHAALDRVQEAVKAFGPLNESLDNCQTAASELDAALDKLATRMKWFALILFLIAGGCFVTAAWIFNKLLGVH